MRTFLIFTLFVYVTVTVANKHNFHSHHHEHDDNHHPHHHKGKMCRGEPIIHDEEYEKSQRECRKEFRSAEELEKNKSGLVCATVCSLTKVGALDERGFIVESKIRSMIQLAVVNTEAREEIEQEIISCGRNVTNLGVSNSDHKCSNYKPYLECAWISIIEACADPLSHSEEAAE